MEFILTKEFESIQNQLEKVIEALCVDLHAVRLSLLNFPKLPEISIPNPYISYFLKGDIHSIVHHANKNIEQILFRVNNNYTLNIITNFEMKIKEAYGLLLALRKQKSMNISVEFLKEKYDEEINKQRTLRNLVNEIIEKLDNVDKNIVCKEKQYYSYFHNYILLRNCLAHKNGLITSDENHMEIRLPIVTQDQIKDAINDGNIKKINPSTIIKNWKKDELIQLDINEVEGIAYGVIKVSYVVIKHLYEAADLHFKGLEKAGK